jgi:predicted CXXCH cytochrome family protein
MIGTNQLLTTELNKKFVTTLCLLTVLLPLSVVVPWSGAYAAISLVYPQPNSIVSTSNHLVIKFNTAEITSVKVSINGLASDPLPVGTVEYKEAYQDNLILQPVWDKGKNEILIETFIADKKSDTLTATIFYSPANAPLPAPKEFAPAVLHQVELEKLCQGCHNMRPTEAQVTNALEKDNPCYVCHKRMANQKYIHGPTGTFSCGYCHSLKGTPRYNTPLRDIAICYKCHADKKKVFENISFVQHGPVAGGMCEVCHDSHGSENPAQLKLPINQMCLSCHEQVGKDLHVTRTASGETHPLSDKPDPSQRGKGREMSCISCHNPHGGKYRYYFQNDAEDRMQLCQMCHQK